MLMVLGVRLTAMTLSELLIADIVPSIKLNVLTIVLVLHEYIQHVDIILEPGVLSGL